MKSSILVLTSLLLGTQAFSQSGDRVEVRGLQISSDSIRMVGTIMTASSDSNKVASAIGWSLILLGSMSNDVNIDLGPKLFNENTEIQLYQDKLSNNSNQLRSNAKKILQDTEMEALMVVDQAVEFGTSIPIFEFAKANNINTNRLADVILGAKQFADQKLNGAQFATSPVFFSREQLETNIGEVSDPEFKIASNYLRLRNLFLDVSF